MAGNRKGHALRIAIGIMALAILLLAGGASAAGESFSAAISLSGSTSGSVSQGSSVYYKFYVEWGQVTVTLTPSSGDQDLTVYDPNQDYVGGSSASGTTVDSITFTVVNLTNKIWFNDAWYYSPGYFYAKAYGSRAGNYSISVSAASATPTPTASPTPTPTPTPTLATIAISPPIAHLTQGQAQQFIAIGRDANGNIVSITPTWSSSNTNVGIISNGIFTALNQGTTTITATSGAITGSAIVTVIPMPQLSITSSQSTITANTPTYVLFTVTSSGTPVSGATVSLSGLSDRKWNYRY